jgi:hypothetical protein
MRNALGALYACHKRRTISQKPTSGNSKNQLISQGSRPQVS